jgi:hypothetical protein
MDSNTHSTGSVEPRDSLTPPGPPDGLAGLIAVVDELAAQDLERLSATVRAERVLALRQLADRLDGQWLQELAGVDARGAAGADHDQPALSTASWLRTRLRLGTGAAREAVRTARALFCGPLPATAAALTAGAISPAHARVLTQGTHQLPPQVATDAEPVLLETAQRLDPPRLRQAVGHLLLVADPEGADRERERRHERRGLWLSPTFDGMVAVDGLLEPEAGHTVLAALEPLARPATGEDSRSGGQRTADALTELARRALEGGRLPKAGGVRPQLLVTVDLDSLLGHPGSLGGDLGWVGPLEPEACRRLACDGTVTRVVVSRHPGGQNPSGQDPDGHPADHGPGGDRDACCPSSPLAGLAGRLRAARAWLPPTLGGAASQPLDVGRATRVVQPAQRAALAARDRGCVVPACDRPLAWCEAHHLWHWLEGGPTDLGNLALLCRAHHRAIHEGGWHLARGPDGRFTATPGPRPHRPHRRRPRAPSAA